MFPEDIFVQVNEVTRCDFFSALSHSQLTAACYWKSKSRVCSNLFNFKHINILHIFKNSNAKKHTDVPIPMDLASLRYVECSQLTVITVYLTAWWYFICASLCLGRYFKFGLRCVMFDKSLKVPQIWHMTWTNLDNRFAISH